MDVSFRTPPNVAILPTLENKELARELLIAISSSVPDTDLNAEHASENIEATNGAAVTKSDGAEKYRSELISISYAQSPDDQVPLVVLRNHVG
ncbi:hypothetical protein GOBAR_AA25547 [Gossypium barbadense]|uniref:Uncharacterized protein n=1 Tax=Gossypium barbadense TaxID=3634 RepID=A0A2P5WVN9_GOSBA|nr:hypothetical protein GOBAR_AA25547 [Gossypium barbadense]